MLIPYESLYGLFLKQEIMPNPIEFLKEAKTELLKVVWPTKERMIRDTVIVLGISFSTAIFLGLLDFAFETLAKKFLF